MKDQLNVRLDPSLVERVKEKAKEEGKTLGAFVGIALKAWLASASNEARNDEYQKAWMLEHEANRQLSEEVEALKTRLKATEDLPEQFVLMHQRLNALEGQPLPQAPTRTNQPVPTLPASAIAPGQLPARRLTHEEAAGIITLPDMADRLGLSGGGSAITNFIGRESKKIGGAMPVGVVYRGFCLLGKGLLPGGQKECWLWKEV
jgi:hypothetical protein